MDKTVKYALGAAFVLVSMFKITQSLLGNDNNIAPEEIPLTLLDVGFGRETRAQSLPDIAITRHVNSEATEFKLTELTGKPIILHFWATWCGPCKKELPNYDKFIADTPTIHHVALTTDGTEKEKIKIFFSQNGVRNVPIMTDKGGAIAKYFGISANPTTIFINKKGVVIGRVLGIVDWQDPKTTELLLQTLSES